MSEGLRAFPQSCERARVWASLQLDGELSELERALLDAHVGGCASCEGFIGGVRSATARLRESAVERPSSPVALPTRRRAPLRSLPLASAAAGVAVALGVGVLFGSFGSSSATPRVHRAGSQQLNPVSAGENVLLRNVRLAQIRAELLSDRQPQRGLGIPI
jgi:hypothetical protein